MKQKEMKGTGNFWYTRFSTSDMQIWLEEMGDDTEKLGRFAKALFTTATTGEIVEVDKDIRLAYKMAAKGVCAAKAAYMAQCEAGRENGGKGVEKSLETRQAKKVEGLECGRPTSFDDFRQLAANLLSSRQPPISGNQLRAYYKELSGADWTIGQNQLTSKDELLNAISARFDSCAKCPTEFYNAVFVPLFNAYGGKKGWDGNSDNPFSSVGFAYRAFTRVGDEECGTEDGPGLEFMTAGSKWYQDSDFMKELTETVNDFIEQHPHD